MTTEVIDGARYQTMDEGEREKYAIRLKAAGLELTEVTHLEVGDGKVIAHQIHVVDGKNHAEGHCDLSDAWAVSEAGVEFHCVCGRTDHNICTKPVPI